MTDPIQTNPDYLKIEKAIRYLDDHFQEQPELDEIAQHVGLSQFHFQRLFRRWVGISPKRFLQFLTVDYARGLLERSTPVLDTAFEAGLSGPSRLHDLFVVAEAVTPGEVRRGGEGVRIRHGVEDSPFGPCSLGITERGLCWLSFGPADATDDGWALERLRARWPHATVMAEPAATADMARRIFAAGKEDGPITVHLRGSNFQLRIWEALLRIPPAHVTSYEDIARRTGNARAVRAAASAIARNPVTFVVPCHRVIRKTGPFHNYAGGPLRKQAILGWEQARFGEGRDEVASAA